MVQARPENAEEVGRIHALSWKAAYCDILSPTDWLGFTPEKRAAVFRRNYQQTPDQTYLFYAAGEAKGMAILGPSWEEEYPEDLGEIGAFYFLPEAWGTGLAQKALHFCCSYFEKNGCQGVLLWVLEDNRRARRFYEKSGFCFDGTRRQFPAAHRICAELRYYRRLES